MCVPCAERVILSASEGPQQCPSLPCVLKLFSPPSILLFLALAGYKFLETVLALAFAHRGSYFVQMSALLVFCHLVLNLNRQSQCGATILQRHLRSGALAHSIHKAAQLGSQRFFGTHRRL